MKELLRIENLRLYFDTEEGTVKALEDVNLSVKEGEIVGVVGETGSGKSITAMSILKLIPTPPARMLSGKIWFDNQEISSFDEEKMREIRGKKIAMIFQEPMTSLNPTFTVGEQLCDVLMTHEKIEKKQAIEKILKSSNW